jgi:hypothetical protein
MGNAALQQNSQANCIGHILRRYFFLNHVIEVNDGSDGETRKKT